MLPSRYLPFDTRLAQRYQEQNQYPGVCPLDQKVIPILSATLTTRVFIAVPRYAIVITTFAYTVIKFLA